MPGLVLRLTDAICLCQFVVILRVLVRYQGCDRTYDAMLILAPLVPENGGHKSDAGEIIKHVIGVGTHGCDKAHLI